MRRAIAGTIALFGGNKLRAADALGIGQPRLYRTLKRYHAHAVNGHLNGRPHRNESRGLT